MTCKNHPFIEDVSSVNGCNCRNIGHDDECSFCFQVKYEICRVQIICVEKIPEYLKSKLLPLDFFLRDRLLSCEPFFIFLVSDNKVNIYIDNQLEVYMHSKETD